MQQLRVGIVGCGEVTQLLHLPALFQLADRFTVRALCDVNQSVLNSVGDQWNVHQRFDDSRDLVASDAVDVVLVANADVFHTEVVLGAAEAGKHVLVEKPMCLTPDEADAIIAAEARTGVTIQVGTMRRYAPAFVEACRRVRAMGPIRLARVRDIIGHNHQFIGPTSRVLRDGEMPAALKAQAQRRREQAFHTAIGDVPADLQSAYGLLLGLNSHDLSAMRELIGRPLRVLYAAQRRQGLYLTAAFDYGDFVCHFETGIDEIARFDAAIEVFGEKSVVEVKYNTPYVRNLPVLLQVTEAVGESGVNVQTLHPAWGDPFVAEWIAFYENVTSQRAPKSSPGDFREDLELFAAMIACMR